MKIRIVSLVLAAGICSSGLLYARQPAVRPQARIYVQADNGFDLYLTAALEKKHVPVNVVTDKSQADFEVGASHSANEAGVKLVDLSNGDVIFAYSTWAKSEHKAEQTAADAFAKRVNNAIEVRRAHRRSKLSALLKKNPAFDF